MALKCRARATFVPREYNGEDKTAAPLATYFRTGENVLDLTIENALELGGLLTPLHLLGDFALGGENRRTLVEWPRTAPFGDLKNAGLPHFSGAVSYRKTLDLQGAVALELPTEFGGIAEIRVAGQTLGVRAWSFYRWNCPPQNGAVEVEIAVTNTLLPFVEGQIWNAEIGVAAGF